MNRMSQIFTPPRGRSFASAMVRRRTRKGRR